MDTSLLAVDAAILTGYRGQQKVRWPVPSPEEVSRSEKLLKHEREDFFVRRTGLKSGFATFVTNTTPGEEIMLDVTNKSAIARLRRPEGELDDHVAARIKARRREVNMTQEQLAKTLDVTFQQIQKYESGMNRVACSRLIKIALALKCHPTFFFEGLEFPEIGMGPGDPDRSTEAMEMVRGINLLSEDQREAVKRLIETFRR